MSLNSHQPFLYTYFLANSNHAYIINDYSYNCLQFFLVTCKELK